MHVGKSKNLCPDLFIDEWKLLKKNELETGFDNLEDKFGDEVMMEKFNWTSILATLLLQMELMKRMFKQEKRKAMEILTRS